MEDGQEQRESSQAELAKLHPMTPLKELPEEEEEEDESSAGGLQSGGGNNNNVSTVVGDDGCGSGFVLQTIHNPANPHFQSIMGKMKMRVSSILPASFSGWFSPSSKGGPESPSASSSSANLRQPQPR